MAFQTPATLQSAVSATAELWPSMSAALRRPLQGLTRRPTPSALAPHSRRAASSQPSSAAPASTLPAFLDSVPLSALRPSAAGLAAAPTVLGNISAVPRNALSSRSPAPGYMLSSLASRQYSTLSRMGLSQLRQIPRVANVGLALAQQRTIFGGPSHSTLARLEQTANNNPSSARAQADFYQALLRANMPQIIVDRHRSGRFAENTLVEQAYQKALEKTGQADQHSAFDNTNNHLTTEQLQAIGQAVGAKAGGGTVGKLRSGSGNRNDPLYVVVEETTWTKISKWIRWALWFAFAVYAAILALSLFAETTNVFKKVGAGKSAEVRPEQQKTRFNDVHGCEEAKEELQDVVDFLKNPDRYNKLGGRLPKGVLLVGPPGTGKTLLARAVAGEAGVPFFYMSGSEFDEVYVGVGAKRIRELFANARSKAPAIVFIDEIDAVGGKRQSRDANYHRQTLNQLLNDLDGFDQSTGVIFIAATNHPEILDKALLRPGRFDRQIQVELPDVKGRLAILKHHTKKIRLAPDVDLTNIARGTPGLSGADLENLANTAAIHASKSLSKAVTVLDLEWAKDKILMGAERKSRTVPLADRVQTAYHEGGHTLIGIYRKGFNEIHKATILPRGFAAGITFFLPQEEHHRSRAQYQVDLEISMGGRMAEEIVYGADNVGDGASGDIQSATRVAYAMVTSFGFSDKLGNVDFRGHYDQLSPETRRLIDSEVRRLIDEAKQNARKILLEKRHELDLLAKALVQYETLDKEEIMKVIKGEKLEGRMIASNDEIKIPVNPTPHLPPIAPPPPTAGGGSGDPEPPTGSGLPA